MDERVPHADVERPRSCGVEFVSPFLRDGCSVHARYCASHGGADGGTGVSTTFSAAERWPSLHGATRGRQEGEGSEAATDEAVRWGAGVVQSVGARPCGQAATSCHNRLAPATAPRPVSGTRSLHAPRSNHAPTSFDIGFSLNPCPRKQGAPHEHLITAELVSPDHNGDVAPERVVVQVDVEGRSARHRGDVAERRALLHLPCGVEAEVGMACALVGQFLNAKTFGLSVAPIAFRRSPSGPYSDLSGVAAPDARTRRRSATYSSTGAVGFVVVPLIVPASPDAAHVLLSHRIAIGGSWLRTGRIVSPGRGGSRTGAVSR